MKDGGSAFPTMGRFIESDGTKIQDPAVPGMSLRDYFAAKALSAMLQGEEHWEEDIIAGLCYQMADAMLVERAKPQSVAATVTVPVRTDDAIP